jgi:GTPase SAR1 family protein
MATTSALTSKKILILGATGAGKSYILNRLLKLDGSKRFPSGCDTQPVTKVIKDVNQEIEIQNGKINVCAFDTPG